MNWAVVKYLQHFFDRKSPPNTIPNGFHVKMSGTYTYICYCDMYISGKGFAMAKPACLDKHVQQYRALEESFISVA